MRKKISFFSLLLIVLSAQSQTNTFPSTGRAGINTTAPTASFQVKGGAKIGTLSNYLNVDSATGNLSFAGFSKYLVGANKYVFSLSSNPKYGLFFNTNSSQYEFRDGNAAPVFYVNADNGNGMFKGSLKIGAYTLPALDGTKGQVLSTNGTGAVSWTTISSILGANSTLSNLESPTAINQSLLPNTSGVRDIGSPTLWWNNIYSYYLNTVMDVNINGLNIGRGSGNNETNTAIGNLALYSNTFGARNTACGYQSLFACKIGIANVAVGSQSLYTCTTGGLNTGIGNQSLYSCTTGSSNTATGNQSLYSCTTGSSNTAYGFQSLYYDTTGSSNTACGSLSLYLNTSGNNNTANGVNALYFNRTGSNNTSNGFGSLYSNITGYNNTSIGSSSLYNNTIGYYNTANGSGALYGNTTGSNNTATGNGALNNNTTGNNNTALGCYADVSFGSTFSNATVIGYSAQVDASNKVRIGNTSVTSIGGQVGWTSFSDGRIKKNIKENVPGLQFINLLKPVTYNYDLAKEYALLGRVDSSNYEGKNDIEKINFTGFVAQEVDAAAKKINYDFSGVDKTGKIMGLRYSEFVVPLVKAVQELDNNEKTDVLELKKENEALKQRIEKLEALLSQTQPTSSDNAQSSTINNQSVTLNSSYSLEQNIPNPFKGTTTINCFLPVNNGNAYINFYSQTGSLLKSIKVTGEGKNTITVNANELASGTYKYALVVDGKVINSKQMILQH